MNSREKIEKIGFGFMEARLLITAVELDLFTAIGGSGRSVSETAALTGTKKAPLERLLNALAMMKLLVKRRGCFKNSAAARRHLTAGSPEPLGDIVRHYGSMWKNWSSLTPIVRTGRVPVRKKSASDTKSFIRGMSNVAAPVVDETARALSRELGRSRRVLDLGGGPGTYARCFAKKHPRLTATVMDLLDVLEIADTCGVEIADTWGV